MALTNTPVFLQTPKNVKFQITSTMVASTNPVAYTAGANGSRVMTLTAAASLSPIPSSAITASLAISTGGTPNYLIGTFGLSTTLGNSSAVGPINVFSALAAQLPIDTDGNPYIPLAIGDTLVCIVGSSISSGTYNLFGAAADF